MKEYIKGEKKHKYTRITKQKKSIICKHAQIGGTYQGMNVPVVFPAELQFFSLPIGIITSSALHLSWAATAAAGAASSLLCAR